MQEMLSDKDKVVLKVERCINDLKIGFYVRVNNYIIMSPETISESRFEYIKRIYCAKSVNLLITESRAKHLQLDGNLLDISSMSYEEVTKISSGVSEEDLSIAVNKDISNIASKTKEELDVSLTLMKLCKLVPSAIILDLSEDADIEKDIISISKDDIYSYISCINKDLHLVCRAPLKLKDAHDVEILVFRSYPSKEEHYAIVIGNQQLDTSQPVNIRIHSSCYTGDLMQSLSCDCGYQLHESIKNIFASPEKSGVVVYLVQEGRGIGFVNKLRTYNLQQQGYDTFKANEILGFAYDERSFEQAASILKALSIQDVNLMSNNPYKSKSLEEFGIKVSKTIQIAEQHEHNASYLKAKKDIMGHNI